MFRVWLIRLGGVSAILAGALRAVAAFVPSTAPRVNTLYFATDVLLLLGLAGLFEFLRRRIGLIGRMGLALAILAGAALIVKDIGILPGSVYPAAALAFALGLDLFAIVSWRVRSVPHWILFFWPGSTIIGPIGYFKANLTILFVISGLMFGVAFAGAGVEMVRRPLSQIEKN